MRLAPADGEDVRSEARSLAATHVAEIRAEIADLQAVERVLTDASANANPGSAQSARWSLLLKIQIPWSQCYPTSKSFRIIP